MRPVTRSIATAFTAAAVLLSGATACNPSRSTNSIGEDCDREDLRNYEDDCGYYNSAGHFILWPWVVPGVGGHRPAGVKVKLPPGARYSTPKRVRPPAVRNAPNPPRVRVRTK